jgi:hypothetical protein
MSGMRLVGAAIGIGVAVVALTRPFVRMPAISMISAEQMRVGEAGGDHARYVIGQSHRFEAVNLGYSMSVFGAGMMGKLGGRATIAFTDDQTYAIAKATTTRGQCGGVDGRCQSMGRRWNLVLIPGNEQALSSMKKARLKSGERFSVSGAYLQLHSARSAG